MTTVTRQIVTQEGQISLPSTILDRLKLTRGKLVELVVESGQVTLREPQNGAAAWLGAARLPEGQTEADFMRELRGKEADEAASEEQRIVWLRSGQPLPDLL